MAMVCLISEKLHETFPSKMEWDLHKLERFIIKYDRNNSTDLYQKISIKDSLSGKLSSKIQSLEIRKSYWKFF